MRSLFLKTKILAGISTVDLIAKTALAIATPASRET